MISQSNLEMLHGNEKMLFAKLCDHLPDSGCFIEVGSNNGRDHCFRLATQSGWRGFCIEANPEIANFGLKKTYENIPEVKTFNYAVTSSRGKVELHIESTENSGVSSIFENRATGLDSGISRRISKTLSVSSISLYDFWLEQNKPDVDLLMTDTEGCDAEIILSTDFSYFRPKFIMAETTFMYYYLTPHLKSNNKIVWSMLNKHLKDFGYDLMLQNNDLNYKKRYCPELIDTPMNAVWKRA